MTLATGHDVVDLVRPTCPSCGVEMWLKSVDRNALKRTPDAFHFQCTICSAVVRVAIERQEAASCEAASFPSQRLPALIIAVAALRAVAVENVGQLGHGRSST